MFVPNIEQQLFERLCTIDEFELCGFSVKEGLTGTGMTILKGSTYFGSWRVGQGGLIWVSALSGERHFEPDAKRAARYTMLRILRHLQLHPAEKPKQRAFRLAS